MLRTLVQNPKLCWSSLESLDRTCVHISRELKKGQLMKVTSTLVILSISMASTILSANATGKASTVTRTKAGAMSLRGSGSECLAGCNTPDHCIPNDRFALYNPHFECRFSWMPYSCTPLTGGVIWCNEIWSTCENPINMLDETTSTKCAEGVPPQDGA